MPDVLALITDTTAIATIEKIPIAIATSIKVSPVLCLSIFIFYPTKLVKYSATVSVTTKAKNKNGAK